MIMKSAPKPKSSATMPPANDEIPATIRVTDSHRPHSDANFPVLRLDE